MQLGRALYAPNTSYWRTYTVYTWSIIQQHYGRKQQNVEFLSRNVQKTRIKGPFYLYRAIEQDYATHRSNTGCKETCGLSGHLNLKSNVDMLC